MDLNRDLKVTSCTGRTIRKGTINLLAGVHTIEVPPAGVAVLKSK